MAPNVSHRILPHSVGYITGCSLSLSPSLSLSDRMAPQWVRAMDDAVFSLFIVFGDIHVLDVQWLEIDLRETCSGPFGDRDDFLCLCGGLRGL